MKQFLLLLLPALSSALVRFEESWAGGNLGLTCKEQVLQVCAPAAPAASDELLFAGIANKITCVTANQKSLDNDCFFKEIDSSLDIMLSTDNKKCHDEVRSKCGKQIDQLKRAVQQTSIIGTVKGAVDVVECLVNHAEDLWEKCKPFEEGKSAETEPVVALPINEMDCSARAGELCPATDNKVLGLGFTLGCLAEQAPVLGMDCVKSEMIIALDSMENSDDKACHDELRKKCGKQIDQLKKEVQQTAIIGIIKGAVDVASCIAENAEDLWKKCSPFEGDDVFNIDTLVAGAPTPPTRKPTHKPTKKPTHKPTKKPTTSTSTTKPTTHKIQEAVAEHAMQYEDAEFFMEQQEEGVVEEPIVFDGQDEVAQVTSVEYDMNACVRSARRHCMMQVEQFNQSPFDQILLQNLNDCIETNAAAIEAECVVSASRFVNFFPTFERSSMHELCRHPEDMTSNLPVCEPNHKCHRHHKKIFLGIVTGFFMVFVVAKCYRRKQQCKNCPYHHRQQPIPTVVAQQQNPGGYVPLKSDNVAAVPVGSIV
jgi:hypothetical protein